MTDQIDNLRSRAAAMSTSFVDMIQSAYDAGFRDGGLAMRDHILQAANAPVSIKAGSVSSNASVHAERRPDLDQVIEHNISRMIVGARAFDNSPRPQPRVASRAPRGLVRTAVEEALRERPGSSITEIEDVVLARHPEVAKKSVGNQLRHFEGDLYRREGKYKWFLMGDAQKETASPGLPPDLADLLGS